MARKATSLIGQLQIFEEEIERLEDKIFELEQKMADQSALHRSHMIRVKNHEEIADDFIFHGKKYQDLSPEKAWKLYQNKDFNFMLIDVSSAEQFAKHHIPEAINMPWEEFAMRSLEIQSKTIPILVISEDGTRSVLACEFLVKRGFYNCNNISGGHLHWRGHRLSAVREESA